MSLSLSLYDGDLIVGVFSLRIKIFRMDNIGLLPFMPTQVYGVSHPPPEVPYARKMAKVSFVCASVNDMKSSSIGSAECGTDLPSVRFIITFFLLPLISQRSKYHIFCIDTHIE